MCIGMRLYGLAEGSYHVTNKDGESVNDKHYKKRGQRTISCQRSKSIDKMGGSLTLS